MIAEDGGQERADGEVLASSLAILDPTQLIYYYELALLARVLCIVCILREYIRARNIYI